MSDFVEYYKKHLFKKTGGQRIADIDFLINDIDAEMQTKVDPTRWRRLLDDRESLELERAEIVAAVGDEKMQ